MVACAMSQSKATVLIIEDDADLQALLGEILRDEGYSVFTAEDGAAALAYLRRFINPDFILLDLNMPRMDGRQFRQEQLKDPGLAKIPVVVVSGAEEAAKAASGLEPAGVLTKPIDLDMLLDTLEHLPPKQQKPLDMSILMSSLIKVA